MPLKVAILRVTARPWGGRAFGVDETGRELWLKMRAPGQSLGFAHRTAAMLAHSVASAGSPYVIEVEELQVAKVTGQAPKEFMEELAAAFRAYDVRKMR